MNSRSYSRHSLRLPGAALCGLCLCLLLLTADRLMAIPQNFGNNGINGGRNNGQDFTPAFLDKALWANGKLPGKWRVGPGLEGQTVHRLMENPFLFGQVPQSVVSYYENKQLKAIHASYIDAGAFFGYDPDAGKAKSKSATLRQRQHQFKKIYQELEKSLRKNISAQTKSQGKSTTVGKSSFLRSVLTDFASGDFTIRFSARENHSIVLQIVRAADTASHFLDPKIASLDLRKRRKLLQANVETSPNKDITIKGVPVFRQGSRPYCAISTLAMAGHYLGLRLDTNSLAAAAQLKNTGSAAGSKMLELYAAAGEEAGARAVRSGHFDFSRARKALEKGLPVIVWRRYSEDRDKLHTAFTQKLDNDSTALLPEVSPAEKASWPDEQAPGHASVITGFNEERGEVIFMESWGEHARNRRMRFEEMEATSYMAFYFKM